MLATRGEGSVVAERYPSEERSPIRGLPRYTPGQIRWLLDHYPDLVHGTRPPRNANIPPPRARQYARDPEKWIVEVKTDLDRGITWLAQIDQDPRGAAVLWSLYCDPQLWRERLGIREVIVAAEFGVTERTIRNWRARAERSIAQFLSGTVDADEQELQDFP